MAIIEMLSNEMEREAMTTRKMLARVPDDKFDWQPHPKSMTIRSLTTHIAELPAWVTMALTTDELDFAVGDYKPAAVSSTADLLAVFDNSLASGRASLGQATADQLEQPWVLRNGENIYMRMTKGDTIRHAFSQTIHHRAQLGVYLRLLDIPIPGSYGPSADEPGF